MLYMFGTEETSDACQMFAARTYIRADEIGYMFVGRETEIGGGEMVAPSETYADAIPKTNFARRGHQD